MKDMLKGLIVKSFGGMIKPGELVVVHNDEEVFIMGFCINYTNGYKSISGGYGLNSGQTETWFYLLDENNKIIEKHTDID